jgi:GntR family transcriptional regulator
MGFPALSVKNRLGTLEKMRTLHRALDGRAGAPFRNRGERAVKYQDVADRMLGRIEASEWHPGDQLPSENELARMYRASVGTIQKALQRLVEDGVLVRRHGSGTFVAVGNIRDEQVRHFRFLSEDERSILPISIEMISVKRVGEQGPWAPFLGDEPSYLCVTRRISINHEFEI